MRTLSAITLGSIAAAALAGAAIAADHKTHRMDVPLPDGSVAQIEYYGDVAPKVTVAPPRIARLGRQWAPPGVPGFAGFGRMMEQMNRQMQQMARAPMAPGINVVSYGGMPAGGISRSITTVSDGQCTRTTEVVSQGDGKPPQVTSNASGNCAGAPAAPRAPAPPPSAEPLDRT